MLLSFSDDCCSKIDYYLNGIKQSEDGSYGSFIIQAEKVNGNCHYKQEGDDFGLWKCEDSWWAGQLSDKGKCKGDLHASTDSKPNVHVQDDSLQWVEIITFSINNHGLNTTVPSNELTLVEYVDLKFTCVDPCL